MDLCTKHDKYCILHNQWDFKNIKWCVSVLYHNACAARMLSNISSHVVG